MNLRFSETIKLFLSSRSFVLPKTKQKWKNGEGGDFQKGEIDSWWEKTLDDHKTSGNRPL
jgi:hypothetical protein